MLALASLTVAFTVAFVTSCSTDAVYAIVPDTNAGVNVTPLNARALRLASEYPARVTTRARQFEQLSQVLVDCGTLGVEARGDFARLPLCSALGRSAVRHCPAMDGIEAGTVSKWRYGQVVDRRIAPRPVGGACRPGRRGCISSPLASLPLGGVLLAYGAVREPHVV